MNIQISYTLYYRENVPKHLYIHKYSKTQYTFYQDFEYWSILIYQLFIYCIRFWSIWYTINHIILVEYYRYFRYHSYVRSDIVGFDTKNPILVILNIALYQVSLNQKPFQVNLYTVLHINKSYNIKSTSSSHITCPSSHNPSKRR